jgi:hypothetical protein
MLQPCATNEDIYRAELALHDARTSGIDSWIRAASDRLHDILQRETYNVVGISARKQRPVRNGASMLPNS